MPRRPRPISAPAPSAPPAHPPPFADCAWLPDDVRAWIDLPASPVMVPVLHRLIEAQNQQRMRGRITLEDPEALRDQARVAAWTAWKELVHPVEADRSSLLRGMVRVALDRCRVPTDGQGDLIDPSLLTADPGGPIAPPEALNDLRTIMALGRWLTEAHLTASDNAMVTAHMWFSAALAAAAVLPDPIDPITSAAWGAIRTATAAYVEPPTSHVAARAVARIDHHLLSQTVAASNEAAGGIGRARKM